MKKSFGKGSGRRTFTCLDCGKEIKGTKAVGDNRVRNSRGRIIGLPAFKDGKTGYKHTKH